MPDDDSVQTERDEGELITMAPAGEDHGNCEVEIASILRYHVKQKKLGQVYAGDTGFLLNDGTVRATDVAFVRQERRLQTGSTPRIAFIGSPPFG